MKDGGSAFPYSALSPEGPSIYKDNEGMSLRDYFAAKAMQGQLACFREFESVQNSSTMQEKLNRMAEISYCASDAMLKARES